MRLKPVLTLIALFLFAPLGAEAASHPTYQSLWDGVAGNCRKETHPDLVLFYCERRASIWYFTQPGTAAHPGVIERKIVQTANGGINIKHTGWSFGPNSTQSAFKALMASIRALDKDIIEDMKRNAN